MMAPDTREGAAATAPSTDARGGEAHSAPGILLPRAGSRERRRVERDFITGGTGLLLPVDSSASSAPGSAGRRADRRSPERADTAREAWIRWLAPHFPPGSAYFTGTYSDDYGLSHGCMLVRNVHRDFRRFLVEQGLTGHEFINGVEPHAWRDVLHLHGIIQGDFADGDMRLLKAAWEAERGFARVLPVLDGCASYVTKYALKNDSDAFDWNTRP